MKVFAISDLHLSLCGDKPMDVFGARWDDYLSKIKADWDEMVSEDDVVLKGVNTARKSRPKFTYSVPPIIVITANKYFCSLKGRNKFDIL